MRRPAIETNTRRPTTRTYAPRLRRLVSAIWRQLCAAPPARRFLGTSLLVVVLAALGTSWWLDQAIRESTVREVDRLGSVYVNAIVTPLLVDSGGQSRLAPEGANVISRAYKTSLQGGGVIKLCVWDTHGRLVYSSDPRDAQVNVVLDYELRTAISGQDTWEVHDPHEADPQLKSVHSQLIEYYHPLRRALSAPVLGVAEVYRLIAPLLHDIATVQFQTALILALGALGCYAVLFGFVRQTSQTVVQQGSRLKAQVTQLEHLLTQNEELRKRTQQATYRTANENEQALSTIRADLHDGVAQYLGAALLNLDMVAAYHEEHPAPDVDQYLADVQSSLDQSMRELRSVIAGLGTPELELKILAEIVAHTVSLHERYAHVHVTVSTHHLPEHPSLLIKMTAYRVLQEGLSNAARHGAGVNTRVSVSGSNESLVIEITDQGPGFDVESVTRQLPGHGLVGMRDRVESLGGRFSVESEIGKGTHLRIELPLLDADGNGR